MGLTENVKQELITVGAGKTSVRTAELATVLRFAGGLHTISGRIAVEAELDSQELATRVRKDLAEIYGVRSEGRLSPNSGGTTIFACASPTSGAEGSRFARCHLPKNAVA